MIIYLADINKHVDDELGLRTEPFLVTWDKVFYEYRKVLMSKYKLYGYGYWYIYSPAKLADKLSVMNYKLNPESIDYNIISLTESNFNITMKGYTFLDTISLFFNREDVSELKLATKLLELEGRTRNINEGPEKEDVSEPVTPLVDILIDLRSYYSKPESHFEFNDLISLFEYDKLETKIFTTIEESTNKYLTNNKTIDKNLYLTFDSLIEELKKESSDKNANTTIKNTSQPK